ncbi:MAG: hypothetical protein VKL39_07995 [Leptolyngbyaceae bacterium]|nr:hypothetical protein [Leptolyngbyaceae bacterium]
MQTLSQAHPQRTPTTEMEVTSIRLERDLKENLKRIAGRQGYQALIRDVLWEYVQQQTEGRQKSCSREDIRASVAATAQKEEKCALTGTKIHPHDDMILGLTVNGEWVPIRKNGLSD